MFFEDEISIKKSIDKMGIAKKYLSLFVVF